MTFLSSPILSIITGLWWSSVLGKFPLPSLRNLITWNLGKTCPQIISLKFPKDKTLHLRELRGLFGRWENWEGQPRWLTLFSRHPLQDSITALTTSLSGSSAETETARLTAARRYRMLLMVETRDLNEMCSLWQAVWSVNTAKLLSLSYHWKY